MMIDMTDAKLREGHVVLCGGGQEPHAFLVRQLGPPVECDECDRTRAFGRPGDRLLRALPCTARFMSARPPLRHGAAAAAAGLLLLALSACANGPRRVHETGPTVTYAYDSRYEREEAEFRAERYCSDYGLDARLLEVDERDGTRYVVYECV